MSYLIYRQAFTYDASGMRQSRSEAGDANRFTLVELLRGTLRGCRRLWSLRRVRPMRTYPPDRLDKTSPDYLLQVEAIYRSVWHMEAEQEKDEPAVPERSIPCQLKDITEVILGE